MGRREIIKLFRGAAVLWPTAMNAQQARLPLIGFLSTASPAAWAYLIEAFKRGLEPPTIKEIFDYLSTKVPDAVARDKQASQHPQIQPSTGPADVRIGVIPRPSGVSP